MAAKNDIIELTVTGLTSEGNGVGRAADGMAVFVPRTAPGDVITATLAKLRPRYAYGILREVRTPSPLRRENDCPVYGRCGGCALRHLSYEAELESKHGWIADSLSRIGKLTPPLGAPLPSPADSRYRNKAQYPIRLIDGKTRTGFFAPRSHRLIPVEDCLLQPAFFARLCRAVCDFADVYGIPSYDEDTHTGLLRHLFLRHAGGTGQTMVCLVINGEYLPGEEALADALAPLCPGALTLCISPHRGRDNAVMGGGVRTVRGNGFIEDTLCGVRLRLSPHSFYQVNRGAAELLYAEAGKYAGLTGRETLLDLYCGAGAIGLSMAERAGQVFGVERVAAAVEDAHANALRNHIGNAEFLHADAGEAAAQLRARGVRPEVVVVDPPRKGVDADALGHIAAMSPERIVYISCDTGTLARDCSILTRLGYDIAGGRGVDLFPRTAHMECVLFLTRR